MRRLVWSPARGSLIAVCFSFFTLSFIGLMYLNVSSISSVVHRCVSGCAPQYLETYCVPVSSIVASSVCVLLFVIFWRYRLTTSARMVIRLSQLPTQRRGTHCQHTLVVWRTAPLHLGDCLKTHLFSEY